MANRSTLGGVIHTYQRYDPVNFPPPTQPPPDLVSPAFESLLAHGSLRELTEEELARAIRLDPSQIAGLGPSLESLRALLEERKRIILSTHDPARARKSAAHAYRDLANSLEPPKSLRKRYLQAVNDEHVRELERLWYQAGGERSEFARELLQLIERLGEKYQIEELVGKYDFTGRKTLSTSKALEIKQELETIDRLLKQLDEATRTAQIGVVDLATLEQFTEPGEVERLRDFQRQVQDLLRRHAEEQGLQRGPRGYQLTPKATRLFQGRLLERIFSNLQAARSGRHQGPVVGEGAVELQQTKEYEFGDSIANMDMPQSLINAMIRGGAQTPIGLKQDDIVIHRTRNSPKCATVVLMDMSGSMRYDGQYVNVKRMALALDGLIRREYPGDYLRFVEVYTFAKPVAPGEIATLMPKMPTIFDPVVHLAADMSREEASEYFIPPHFTNIQHGLQQARRLLALQDTPNRQIILITDGLPTAHWEDAMLYMLYPPHARTEAATLREGMHCQREGITINIFLLPSWSQTREDVRFAYKLAEGATGRVFFVGGRDLDRFVVWDYVNRRRDIVA